MSRQGGPVGGDDGNRNPMDPLGRGAGQRPQPKRPVKYHRPPPDQQHARNKGNVPPVTSAGGAAAIATGFLARHSRIIMTLHLIIIAVCVLLLLRILLMQIFQWIWWVCRSCKRVMAGGGVQQHIYNPTMEQSTYASRVYGQQGTMWMRKRN